MARNNQKARQKEMQNLGGKLKAINPKVIERLRRLRGQQNQVNVRRGEIEPMRLRAQVKPKRERIRLQPLTDMKNIRNAKKHAEIMRSVEGAGSLQEALLRRGYSEKDREQVYRQKARINAEKRGIRYTKEYEENVVRSMKKTEEAVKKKLGLE